jgi:hypothetical protein
MKSHLVSIFFDTPYGKYQFTGRVRGKEINGKLVVSPEKIFKTVFGFELPDHSRFLWG